MAELIGQELHDPRVRDVVISNVKMPDDLRSANIYIRLLPTGQNEFEKRKKEAITSLARLEGFFRHAIGERLNLRYTPTLRFFYDDSQEKQERIDELLHEIEVGRNNKPS